MRVAGIVGALLLPAVLAAPAAQGVVVRLGDAVGPIGGTVEVEARLDAGFVSVAGTQNDIEIAPPLYVALRNGRPDCAVDAGLDKNGTAFSLLPCDAGECDRVRALVLALDNVDPIADGAVLYRCRIDIDPSAEAGVYPLRVTNVGAADPQGGALVASGLDGSVLVGGIATAHVRIDDATAAPGSATEVGVRLIAGEVARLTVEITHAPDTPPVTTGAAALPACDAAAGLQASFAFQPPDCVPHETCTALRAEVGAGDVQLPLDVPLFTCRFRPRPVAAPGRYALGCGTAFGRDAGGHALALRCSGGTLDVVAASATATLAPGAPTHTPTPTPAAGEATHTATAAAVRTATGNPCGACPPGRVCELASGMPVCVAAGVNDDGCAVAPATRGAGPLLLLAGALALRAARRF